MQSGASYFGLLIRLETSCAAIKSAGNTRASWEDYVHLNDYWYRTELKRPNNLVWIGYLELDIDDPFLGISGSLMANFIHHATVIECRQLSIGKVQGINSQRHSTSDRDKGPG
jgi:hypothetical protein